MDVVELKVPGAWSFTPRQFADPRGVFLEWFKGAAFEEAVGHPLSVKQANHSVSSRGTLRGVHFADGLRGRRSTSTAPAARCSTWWSTSGSAPPPSA